MDKRERHTNLVDVKERPTKKDRYLVLAKAQRTTTQAQAITTTTIAFGMRQFCAPFSLLLSPLATRSSLPPSLPTPSCPTHFLHSFLVVFIYLFSPFFRALRCALLALRITTTKPKVTSPLHSLGFVRLSLARTRSPAFPLPLPISLAGTALQTHSLSLSCSLDKKRAKGAIAFAAAFAPSAAAASATSCVTTGTHTATSEMAAGLKKNSQIMGSS